MRARTFKRPSGTTILPAATYARWALAAMLFAGSAAATPASSAAEAAAWETSSGDTADSAANGPVDGNRFADTAGSAWQGSRDATSWWWQVDFGEARQLGSILQVHGADHSVLANAPQRYVWRWSDDGTIWHNLRETEVARERRLFRIHRLQQPIEARYLRLHIYAALGEAPIVREIEFFPDIDAKIHFDEWIVAVSTFEESKLPGPGQSFIQLAKACPQWKHLEAQEVWMGDFDEQFVATEPRPLCAFLSGNLNEWCEKMHEPWRGVQQVLKNRNLPMWGACGGAQGMAILDQFGVDHPWDCPRCRDPAHPSLPIYTHIGHTGLTACGDYSKNIFERGPCNVLQIAKDPVLEGLPCEFAIMESHCGQIEYVPPGWKLIVTCGSAAHTKVQCMRVADRYIYAAQFHMEMEGTPENSQRLMSNFLGVARSWGGYNPAGEAVGEPESFE